MHPILIHIPTPWGAVPIYSYGVMLGSSLLVAWYFVMWAGYKKEGFSREIMANAFTWTAICSIVGARLLYILTNLEDYQDLSKWFALRSGGMVAYGGFLGGFFGTWFYLRILKKIPLLPWADVLAPTLGSGLMITRLGCWLYGCDFGKPLGEHAPGWLTKLGTFPKWELSEAPELACDQRLYGSPAYQHHVANYFDRMDPNATASLPVHPTQIYEALAGLALTFIALWILKKRQFRGQVFIAISGLYAVWRFFIEYLRDDPERGAAFGFSTSQLVSLMLIPICIFAYMKLKRRAAEQGDIQLPAHALEPEAN